jgi:hypothetical protein
MLLASAEHLGRVNRFTSSPLRQDSPDPGTLTPDRTGAVSLMEAREDQRLRTVDIQPAKGFHAEQQPLSSSAGMVVYNSKRFRNTIH